MPETVSDLEIIRLLVALVGIYAALRGVGVAQQSIDDIPTDPTDDAHERAAREQRHERMELFRLIQRSIFGVHGLLLVNVLVNFGYAPVSVVQPNVLTSNIAQILIPLILVRASEKISSEIRTVTRIRIVIGPRPTGEPPPMPTTEGES